MDDETKLKHGVKFFSHHFVRRLEIELASYKKIIYGEHAKTGKSMTQLGTTLAGVLYCVGLKPVGKLMGFLNNTISQKYQRNNKMKYLELVMNFDTDRVKFKEDMTKVALGIFYSYEYQFMNILMDGNSNIAIKALAEKAAMRAMKVAGRMGSDKIEDYFVAMNQTGFFGSVKDSVVSDSMIFKGGDCEVECTANDLFENLYTEYDKSKSKLGYRRCFQFEIENDIEKGEKHNTKTQPYLKEHQYYEDLKEEVHKHVCNKHSVLDDDEIITFTKAMRDELQSILQENMQISENLTNSIKELDLTATLESFFSEPLRNIQEKVNLIPSLYEKVVEMSEIIMNMQERKDESYSESTFDSGSESKPNPQPQPQPTYQNTTNVGFQGNTMLSTINFTGATITNLGGSQVIGGVVNYHGGPPIRTPILPNVRSTTYISHYQQDSSDIDSD